MKKLAIISLVWFAIGCVCGFFMGKAKYDKSVIESVTRDTVTIVDTIPHYFPQPIESVKTKTVYKWLTRVVTETDTIFRVNSVKDSVLVEVPIESRHYHAPEYDAWVSGYEPSLDSIKVYQKETLITEVRTISKPPNRWELDVVGGINHYFNKKKYVPYAGGELLYKPNRLQVGIRGGIEYDNKIEPVIGGVIKIRVF